MWSWDVTSERVFGRLVGWSELCFGDVLEDGKGPEQTYYFSTQGCSFSCSASFAAPLDEDALAAAAFTAAARALLLKKSAMLCLARREMSLRDCPQRWPGGVVIVLNSLM